MKKISIVAALALATAVAAHAEEGVSVRAVMARPSMVAGQGQGDTREGGVRVETRAMVTGDASIDAQIKALLTEEQAKIKAIHDDYQARIKKLIGDRKPIMASSTASTSPRMMHQDNEGRENEERMMGSTTEGRGSRDGMMEANAGAGIEGRGVDFGARMKLFFQGVFGRN